MGYRDATTKWTPPKGSEKFTPESAVQLQRESWREIVLVLYRAVEMEFKQRLKKGFDSVSIDASPVGVTSFFDGFRFEDLAWDRNQLMDAVLHRFREAGFETRYDRETSTWTISLPVDE